MIICILTSFPPTQFGTLKKRKRQSRQDQINKTYPPHKRHYFVFPPWPPCFFGWQILSQLFQQILFFLSSLSHKIFLCILTSFPPHNLALWKKRRGKEVKTELIRLNLPTKDIILYFHLDNFFSNLWTIGFQALTNQDLIPKYVKGKCKILQLRKCAYFSISSTSTPIEPNLLLKKITLRSEANSKHRWMLLIVMTFCNVGSP